LSNPYDAPSADLTLADNGSDLYEPQLFSFHGRIGRCRYLAYSVALTLILMLVSTLANVVLVRLLRSTTALIVFGLIWYLPFAVIVFSMAVRRLNDLNRAGWWSLLYLVPGVNLLVWLWLIFFPGDDAANDYGPAPGPNTWPVIVGACVMPVMVVAIIGILAAIAIPAYKDYEQKARAAQRAQPPARLPQ
jgi:uncharacterized membrane protein YhaH (DUF805 family)